MVRLGPQAPTDQPSATLTANQRPKARPQSYIRHTLCRSLQYVTHNQAASLRSVGERQQAKRGGHRRRGQRRASLGPATGGGGTIIPQPCTATVSQDSGTVHHQGCQIDRIVARNRMWLRSCSDRRRLAIAGGTQSQTARQFRQCLDSVLGLHLCPACTDLCSQVSCQGINSSHCCFQFPLQRPSVSQGNVFTPIFSASLQKLCSMAIRSFIESYKKPLEIWTECNLQLDR